MLQLFETLVERGAELTDPPTNYPGAPSFLIASDCAEVQLTVPDDNFLIFKWRSGTHSLDLSELLLPAEDEIALGVIGVINRILNGEVEVLSQATVPWAESIIQYHTAQCS